MIRYYHFLFVVALLVSSFKVTYAQESEVGLWLGGLTYFGDLNTSFNPLGLRPGGGLMLRRSVSPYISFKGTLGGGGLAGTDNRTNKIYQQTRNLSFKSVLIEGAFLMEIHFLKYLKKDENHHFTPYLVGGVAGFYNNPTPIHTEKRYSLFQGAIPYGLGFKWNIEYHWNFGIEIANRVTFTDYLDDVSAVYNTANSFGTLDKQRGDTQKNDQYLVIALSITYNVRKAKCPNPSSNLYDL